MDTSSRRRPTVAQVFLGLFVVWQLLFLLAGNLLGGFPHGEPDEGEITDCRSAPATGADAVPLQSLIDRTAGVTDYWSSLTGQIQSWWLFAPDVPHMATFPVVELRWDEGKGGQDSGTAAVASTPSPVRLRSVFEPDDPHSYLRFPGSYDRLFHYEARLGLIMLTWDEKSVAQYPELWRQAFEERVRRQWKSIRAYLRWRVQQFQGQHPELPPPKQAILLFAIYRTPLPAQSPPVWEGPIERPLARWHPGVDCSAGYLPVQWCDPVTGHFMDLRVRD